MVGNEKISKIMSKEIVVETYLANKRCTAVFG